MKKTFKVVMLPTKKASRLSVLSSDKLNYGAEAIASTNTKLQHLYILSDDEIKEGDWYIDDVNSVRQSVTSDKDYWSRRKDYKKIVATTNKSLTIKSNYKIDYIESLSEVDEQLPQIPESFIQAYIKAYNEGKPITEVDLEVDDNYLHNESNKDFLNNCRIKTRPDNTVIVHQSKMYTRDEVINLICNIPFDIDLFYGEGSLNKWIQDNL